MMHQRLRTQILRRNWVYLRSSCIAQVSYILLEHIRRTLKILIESGYFYWFILGKSKFSGMLIFKGFGTQNMKTSIPRPDLSSDIVHSHPQLLIDKVISTSEIRAIYIDKKKGRGSLTVSNFALVTPLKYFCRDQYQFMLKLSSASTN